ncbi:hypothetical protein D9M70_535080 [compost metagenome]
MPPWPRRRCCCATAQVSPSPPWAWPACCSRGAAVTGSTRAEPSSARSPRWSCCASWSPPSRRATPRSHPAPTAAACQRQARSSSCPTSSKAPYWSPMAAAPLPPPSPIPPMAASTRPTAAEPMTSAPSSSAANGTRPRRSTRWACATTRRHWDASSRPTLPASSLAPMSTPATIRFPRSIRTVSSRSRWP